jgi:hypothetical protein
MKRNQIILAALVAGGLSAVSAQAQYLNTFGSSSSPFRFDYGTVASDSVTWASGPTFDAGGSAGSGSADLSWTWASSGSGQGAAFTADLFGTDQNYVGATLSFDIYVASSSTPGTDNSYGYFQVFNRDDGYAEGPGLFNESLVGGVVSATGQWQHVSVTLGADASTLRALTFQDYDNGNNIAGSETIYIDNLSLTPVPEPSTIALAGIGLAGLLGIRRFRKN